MSEENVLRETMKALAAESAQAEASPGVRAALLKEVRARRARHVAPWWMAAAALLAIGVLAGVWSRTRPPAASTASVPEQPVVVKALAPERTVPEMTQPVAAPRRVGPVRPRGATLVTATPWMVHQALSPVERGQVLRLPMSAELARQFGVPQQSGEWQAEIFVGDDGLARAFRLVRTPDYK